MKDKRYMTMQNIILIRNTGVGSECVSQTNQIFKDKRHPSDLLNLMCMAHGSTLKGRTDAFCALTGARQKAAVLISERTRQIFFPSESKRNDTCVWISYTDVVRVKGCGNLNCQVTFASGYSALLKVDVRVIKRQMARCRIFLERLDNERFVQIEAKNAKRILIGMKDS